MKRTTDQQTSGGVLILGKGSALPTKRSKYGNIKTVVNGITFDSQHEARRYEGLRILERQGIIRDLELQVRYRLTVNGVWIFDYIADFVYVDVGTNKVVVEDAKSDATRKIPLYEGKKRLMKALYNIDIIEV